MRNLNQGLNFEKLQYVFIFGRDTNFSNTVGLINKYTFI